MTDDRMRALFLKADAGLGYAPPDLERTIRKAKRDTVRQRVFAGAGIAALLVVAGIGAAIAFRPEARTITPIASGSPAPAPVQPCGDLSEIGDNPRAFVEQFMQRRIDGSGAEACMSDEAVDQYAAQRADPYDPNANGGAGSLCLYRCGDFRVVEYYFDTEPMDADANSYQAAVIVQLSDGNETVRQYEAFAFGPGVVSTTDEQQAFVIRGAWTTPGLP